VNTRLRSVPGGGCPRRYFSGAGARWNQMSYTLVRYSISGAFVRTDRRSDSVQPRRRRPYTIRRERRRERTRETRYKVISDARNRDAASWRGVGDQRRETFCRLLMIPRVRRSASSLVLYIATAAAIHSLGHGLRTFIAVPRSTRPSTLRGTVR